MLPGQRAEGLVGTLEDALGANVDPAAGRHLAVHDEALLFPAVEILLGGPGRHDVGIGQQNPGRVRMGAEDGHRLARLDHERFVRLQIAQGGQNRVKGAPVAGRAAPPSVDDEVVGIKGDGRIEIVLQHAIGRFDLPVLAGQGRSPGSMNGSRHDSLRFEKGGPGAITRSVPG